MTWIFFFWTRCPFKNGFRMVDKKKLCTAESLWWKQIFITITSHKEMINPVTNNCMLCRSFSLYNSSVSMFTQSETNRNLSFYIAVASKSLLVTLSIFSTKENAWFYYSVQLPSMRNCSFDSEFSDNMENMSVKFQTALWVNQCWQELKLGSQASIKC